MEMDYEYPVETEVGDLDANGLLKPHGYQKLFARIAEAHLNRLNLNVDATLPHNLAWALVSMSFELTRPVLGCVRLTATTWHSQRKGPYFRRELVFRDEAGETVFHGSTFSVLLDMTTRGVFRRRETPFPIAPPHEEFVMDASHSIQFGGTYTAHEKRMVRNSHIDALGHVNNIRYGEYALDALTPAECARLGDLRRMDIRFVSELRPQASFLVERAVQGDRVGIRGVSPDGETIHFEYVLTFTAQG